MSESKSGLSMTVEGYTLGRLISRCRNPKDISYARYGGRGITVCDDWLYGRDGLSKYETFILDMGMRPRGCSIDRIDNDKGYSPDNCRWATRLQQNCNKSNNSIFTHDGLTLHLAEWARLKSVPEYTIRRRLKRGLTFAESVRPMA